MAVKTTRKPARKKSSAATNTPSSSKNDTLFGRFARKVAAICGKPSTFLFMVGIVVVWAVSGPVFGYSETWQLVINTGTTIITFLMVFVIQNTQNKDTQALQLKLDELIRANKQAHNALMILEELSQEELDAIKCTYIKLAEEARDDLRAGAIDENKPHATETFNIAKPSKGSKS